MSKSKSRRRRRKNRAMFVTILTFVLLGALLILILVVLSQAGGKKTDTPAMSTLDNPVAILSASDSPVSTFTRRANARTNRDPRAVAHARADGRTDPLSHSGCRGV